MCKYSNVTFVSWTTKLKGWLVKHVSGKDEVNTTPWDLVCVLNLRMIYGIPMRHDPYSPSPRDNAGISLDFLMVQQTPWKRQTEGHIVSGSSAYIVLENRKILSYGFLITMIIINSWTTRALMSYVCNNWDRDCFIYCLFSNRLLNRRQPFCKVML